MGTGGFQIGMARRIRDGQRKRPSGAMIGKSLKWDPKLIPDYERTGGGLNPSWIEWLLGFPIGWTDSANLAIASFLLSQLLLDNAS